mgnify:CR=1 FL=1
MQVYSQRDPLWSKAKIGNSGYFIEQFGCTLTCVAMLASYFGDKLTPLDIARRCKFTNDAKIIWSSVNFEHFEFDYRYYQYSKDIIDRALADPDLAVILEVKNKKHWVVATGRTWFLDKYRIADPWNGDRATLARYGNTVNGFALFCRKQ